MTIADRISKPGQKKLLALDGGGIRGALTIEILADIEAKLRAQRIADGLMQASDKFVLADYFDYIAGTSTGAIIASCLSWGMSTDEIRSFYETNGETMFDSASIQQKLTANIYSDQKLAEKLQEVFRQDDGSPATLGTAKLHTLLMMVMRNASTDSPWWVCNNPAAKYNRPERRAAPKQDCNLDIPLWQLIRASTAAPVFFPPERVQFGNRDFEFVDGGVTPHNNPAFQLFIMATSEPYQLKWPTGEDKMLLVSIGTGASPDTDVSFFTKLLGKNYVYQATHIPNHLMYGALNEQDMLCRVFGKCLSGAKLDNEVEDLIGKTGPAKPKLFTYMRYNAELTQKGLSDLGLGHIDPENVRKLDSVENIKDLQAVGKAVAERCVNIQHFAGFFN
jgi:uncharacterized protein